MLLWLSLFVALLVGARIYAVAARPLPPARRRQRRKDEKCSLAIFLGSGGHTAEAISLLRTLDLERYAPRTYIISEGDTLSAKKAAEFEASREPSSSNVSDTYRITVLPRARRVHQSFLTTPPTFVKSLLVALHEITFQPAIRGVPFAEVMILNGPGTCVPVVCAVYLSRLLGLPAPKLIYAESFARVNSLSLSAKLLRPFVDRFIVQWPGVLKDGRRGECRGWLV